MKPQEFTIPQQFMVGDIKINTKAQLDRTYLSKPRHASFTNPCSETDRSHLARGEETQTGWNAWRLAPFVETCRIISAPSDSIFCMIKYHLFENQDVPEKAGRAKMQ